MSTEIIVAIITGVVMLTGTIITAYVNHRNMTKQLKAQSDLTVYRIEQLEKKVEKHNNLIERTYRLEEKVADHDKEIEKIRSVTA